MLGSWARFRAGGTLWTEFDFSYSRAIAVFSTGPLLSFSCLLIYLLSIAWLTLLAHKFCSHITLFLVSLALTLSHLTFPLFILFFFLKQIAKSLWWQNSRCNRRHFGPHHIYRNLLV